MPQVREYNVTINGKEGRLLYAGDVYDWYDTLLEHLQYIEDIENLQQGGQNE